MYKKVIFVILFFIFIQGFGQNYEENRFNASEENTNQNKNYVANTENDGPSDPPNPVPINDYIPLLILVAVGGIVYYQSKKKILK